MSASAVAPVPHAERRTALPVRIQAAMFLRMLAVQGSWNYEILLGNGIGFCLEPALRLLPEGIGWLPFCSLLALAVFGLGAGPFAVLATFLASYNLGHFALRLWGLRTGWRNGLRVATALGHPVLRSGPQQIGRIAALATGVAIPLALYRVIGPGRVLLGGVLVSVVVGALILVRLRGRIEGWRLALFLIAAFALFSVAH